MEETIVLPPEKLKERATQITHYYRFLANGKEVIAQIVEMHCTDLEHAEGCPGRTFAIGDFMYGEWVFDIDPGQDEYFQSPEEALARAREFLEEGSWRIGVGA